MQAVEPCFYGVRCGFQPGVYLTWHECKIQVDGFTKPEYRKFDVRQEAEDYILTVGRSLKPRARPVLSNPLETDRRSTPLWLYVSSDKDDDTKLWHWSVATAEDYKSNESSIVLYGTQPSVCAAWLQAASRGLSWARIQGKEAILLHHASNYLHGCIHGRWMEKWAKQHWRRSNYDKSAILHRALVISLYKMTLTLAAVGSFCNFTEAAQTMADEDDANDDNVVESGEL